MNLKISKYFKDIYYGADNAPFQVFMRRFLYRVCHPYQRVRYYPVVNYLVRADIQQPAVLELGSGSTGITMYYPHEVTGLDVGFLGPQLGLLRMVTGDSRKIPFFDASFDYTISMDMLEHLKEEDRGKVVREMLRVSRRGIILGFPSGEEARKAEVKLSDCLQLKLRRLAAKEAARKMLLARNWFLEQHLAEELPERNRICSLVQAELQRCGVKARIQILGNERVWLWYQLMKARLDFGFLYFLFSVILNSVPQAWLSSKDLNTCYRAILFVEKET